MSGLGFGVQGLGLVYSRISWKIESEVDAGLLRVLKEWKLGADLAKTWFQGATYGSSGMRRIP